VANEQILACLKTLPTQAGVYQYFDQENRLLYVGKAKNLKNRLKSYWRFTPSLHPNPHLSPRIVRMLEQSVRLEYLVVPSENDALILENTLIKQLKPKYNILLRDDKTYPYIYIDESQPFPRFELTRTRIQGKKITYYGPFPQGGRVLLETLYELFPLVQKNSCLRGKKACLFHQIKRCLAPCEGKITPHAYQKIVQEVKEAIVQRSILTQRLNERMMAYALQERYEEAATLRDKIKTIEQLSLHSQLDLANHENLDIFAIEVSSTHGVIVKLFMREGKIIASHSSTFRGVEHYDPNEAYKQTLLEFYTKDTPHPVNTILVAHSFEDQAEIATLLSEQQQRKVTILHPKRGKRAKLTQLALANANEQLNQKPSKHDTSMESAVASLFELSTLPYRVEIFDNSHLMGSATVGAMVVWQEGTWQKSAYRHYTLHAPDEYAQMQELLSRRIQTFATNPPPDLWVLDGGETLRQLATKLLDQAGVNLEVIAIAKAKLDAKAHRAKGAAKDIIYTQRSVFELPVQDKRLQWVQRLRDEAHRFALAFHQQQKRKADQQNRLLEKKGIGPATVKKLLHYFGTFEAINQASFEEISVASSQKIATILKTDSIKK